MLVQSREVFPAKAAAKRVVARAGGGGRGEAREPGSKKGGSTSLLAQRGGAGVGVILFYCRFDFTAPAAAAEKGAGDTDAAAAGYKLEKQFVSPQRYAFTEGVGRSLIMKY